MKYTALSGSPRVENQELVFYANENELVLIAYVHCQAYLQIERTLDSIIQNYDEKEDDGLFSEPSSPPPTNDKTVRRQISGPFKRDLIIATMLYTPVVNPTFVEQIHAFNSETKSSIIAVDTPHQKLFASCLYGVHARDWKTKRASILDKFSAINLYARHAVRGERIAWLQKLFNDRDTWPSKTWLLAILLWCNCRTMDSLHRTLEAEEDDDDRCKKRGANNVHNHVDDRIGIVMRLIENFMLHHDLYTLDDAKLKLRILLDRQATRNESLMTMMTAATRFYRYRLFRLCFDQPGHFQILAHDKTTGVIDVTDYICRGDDGVVGHVATLLQCEANGSLKSTFFKTVIDNGGIQTNIIMSPRQPTTPKK